MFVQVETADGKVVLLNTDYIVSATELPSSMSTETMLQVFMATGPHFVVKEDLESFSELIEEYSEEDIAE